MVKLNTPERKELERQYQNGEIDQETWDSLCSRWEEEDEQV